MNRFARRFGSDQDYTLGFGDTKFGHCILVFEHFHVVDVLGIDVIDALHSFAIHEENDVLVYLRGTRYGSNFNFRCIFFVRNLVVCEKLANFALGNLIGERRGLRC